MKYKKVNQDINNIVNEQVRKLESIFPAAVKDGEVDFEALREELGQFQEVDNEKYELTWAGKKNAKRIAQEDIVGRTLKFIPEDSKNADTTENLYIEGDNLEVLKLLRQNYYGAIKMIYIDPPYNTGNDFVYNDTFVMSQEESDIAEGTIDEWGERFSANVKTSNRYHASWLNMMYSRLKVARDLLTEDGVLFISIDDNEQENLRICCDEIFGAQNFVAQLIWERAYAPKNDAKFVSNSHDYVIMYAKNVDIFTIGRLPRTEEANARYKNPDNDPRGVWKPSDLSVKTYNAACDYPITTPSGRVIESPAGRCWSLSKNAFLERLQDNRIYFGIDGNSVPCMKRFLTELKYDGMAPTSIMPYKEVGHSQEGAKEVTALMKAGVFDGPKPVRLIMRLLVLANLKDDSLVLDFFSGSGTTAQALMEFNLEKESNCKFIVTQIPELTDDNGTASKAGYKNICEIGKERIRRAGDKIRSDHPDADIDIGFKVFRTADTNIKWNSIMDMGQINVNQLEYTPDLVDFMPGANDIDIVYELMLRQRDVALSETLEQLSDIGSRTYLYASSYLVCLEITITEDLVSKLAKLDPLPIKFIFRDSAFKDDISLKDETFRKLKALIEKNAGASKPTYTVEFI
ncbi:site-specific DNA-methyltransferase [Roseburia faecis]|uniref:site-specific DNA-methyltransferase n=1 Tax=Roseburia faecis TaxID=301302 RepID=UPI003F984E8E